MTVNVESYLGAKWVEGGRVWPEIDCYGIVLTVREDLQLPPWPIFDGVTKKNGMHEAASSHLANLPQCEPYEGAVACCYKASLMVHVGIVVNTPTGLAVLECNPGTNVSCVPLGRFKRKFLRVEFYP
ncbi:nitrite transporter [Rheinheimera sp. 1928-s]|uniref:nitrite transporter n=1 Tax=Rheinheimera sp. 1928-s TaxID=3033803 RepID=UPI0026254170|nr:nitrite transporter [Rheinheimera sp. 1928-s]MDF3127391.1 nitrite transporter [Rheinheimera sp. 1928-s]